MAPAALRRAFLAVSAATLAAAVGASPARAAAPLDLTQCQPAQGVVACSGLVKTWDGVPLDTTVVLPTATARRLPLVVEIHGFGNSKYEYLQPDSTAYTDNAFGWARRGYAVLTYSARGFWGSCGTPESRTASPDGCARGYIHLADARYEARDTQELVGRLVDEGYADPAAIGVTGDSYGGGQTFLLDALRDRMMLPDGSLVPWRSPGGTRLRIAAAAPVIPWTDLPYAIAPNGRTLTYAISPPAATTSPLGVLKASIANAIFAAAQSAIGPGQPPDEPFVPGRPMGYLAPPGVDPEADVISWVQRSDAGEPYDDATARAIVDTLERYHSAYGIDSREAPAPLLVASGFTDDIFPVDEALRFANRTRRAHPGTPVSLLFGDFGHQRASNKPADRERLIAYIRAWFDRYLRHRGHAPRGVTATTQTCPHNAPSGGPFTAATFAALAHGEVRYVSKSPQTVSSTGGDPRVAAAIDPASGGGDACVTTTAAAEPGTAAYALPAARGRGYTLLGAPTIVARLDTTAAPGVSELAARLWDVAADGATQTLVARGLSRPTGGGREVWQLHANGWRFAAGHVPKLELLGADAPYGRPSNQQFQVDVAQLELRLPVREQPDCAAVLPAAAPVVPGGDLLAPGVSSRAAGRCPLLRLEVTCTGAGLRATARVLGGRARAVDFYAGRRRVARDRRAPFRRVLRTRRRVRRAIRVTARATLPSGRRIRASRVARACPRPHRR